MDSDGVVGSGIVVGGSASGAEVEAGLGDVAVVPQATAMTKTAVARADQIKRRRCIQPDHLYPISPLNR